MEKQKYPEIPLIMKRIIFFFAVAMILTAGLNAQTLTVAEGTYVSHNVPMSGYKTVSQKCHTLYPDSMLSDMVGKHITSLTYYIQSSPSVGCIERVRMGVTPSSNLQNGLDSASVVTVWTGTLSSVISGDTMSITLDNPFPYTGGNLLIEMEQLTLWPESSYSSYHSVYGINPNAQLSYYSCHYINQETSYYGESFLPKITFAYEEGCFAPLNAQASCTGPGTVSLSWRADPIQPAQFYTVGYKKVSDTVFTEITITDTFQVVAGLQDATRYEWRVRAHCGTVGVSDWNYAGQFTTAQPATLPYLCDFENADERNSWQFVNYNYYDKWYIDSAVNNGGNYSLYISNNGGATNTYYSSYASFVWAYRDIYFDPADSGYSLSFDIRSYATDYGFSAITDVYLGPPAVPDGLYLPEGATALATGLYGISNWTTKTYPIDHSYAGLQRLYFLWSHYFYPAGNNPPAAIDNIAIEGGLCHIPVSLSEYDIIDTMAYLSWTMPNGSADYYTIAYKSLSDTVFSYITSQSEQFPLGNLTPSTSYIWKVRAHCNATEFGVWSEESTFQTMENVARIPYFCGFEDATENSGWYFDNGTDTYNNNQWVISHAVNNGGDSSLYVSKDNGATNSYSANYNGSIWAYRDIYLDPSYSDYMISFDCRAQGKYLVNYNEYRAYAKVYLGMPNNLTQIGGVICLDSTWHTVSVQLDSSFAGPQRICIQWFNDYNYAYDPPGAIDNISIIGSHCHGSPTNLAASASNTSANLSWSMPDNSAYHYTIAYKSQNDTAYTYITVQNEQFTLDNLAPSTLYIWKVRANCSATDYGFWSEIDTFLTSGHLANLLYACDFEDASDNANWTFVNGNYANKWCIGSAVNNGGAKALYISDNNGVSNTYNTNSTAHVWAYRDFFFPSGPAHYQIMFDVRCLGDWANNHAYDFVKVYLATPNGTQVIPTNATQLGGAYLNNSQWQTEEFILDSTFAGPQRLFVYWENDHIFGDNPPGAVDNIMIYCDDTSTSCITPDSLMVDSASTNSISIRFTPASEDDEKWQVVIMEADQPLDTTQVITLSGSTYTFNGLQDNTAYTIYVRTDCGESQSEWCSVTQWTDSIPECLPPTDVTATPLSYDSVLVNWQPGGSETAWHVLVVLTDDSLDAGTSLLTDTYPVTIGNLMEETSYTVFVQSDCGDASSLWSSPVVFVTLPNGIVSHELDRLVLLYPNPTGGKCTVSNGQGLIETVELYDIFGKRLEFLHVNDCQVELNLSAYAAGLYFVRVTTEQGKITKRVVKR